MKGTINGNRLPRGTKIKKKVGNANHYSTPFCRRLAHVRGNVLVRGPAVPTSGIFKINYRKIRRDFLLTLSVVWSVLYHIILYHIISYIVSCHNMITFRWVLETKKTHLKLLFHNKDAGLKEKNLIVSTTRDITEAVMINHMYISGCTEKN